MNVLLAFGAVWGFVSVLMGASTDHVLQLDMDDARSMETAIRYNMLYAVMIVVLSFPPTRRLIRLSAALYAAGSTLFSGGIYIALLTGWRELTYLTPVGGITIMAAWITLAVAALTWKKT